jgi:hypothetical protein
MEHIVQFAINFDDKRITQAVEKNAEKAIIDDLKGKVNDNLFKSDYYGGHGNPKSGFSGWMTARVEDFLEAHKREIIDTAGRYLADRLSRTKAARELLNVGSTECERCEQ